MISFVNFLNLLISLIFHSDNLALFFEKNTNEVQSYLDKNDIEIYKEEYTKPHIEKIVNLYLL